MKTKNKFIRAIGGVIFASCAAMGHASDDADDGWREARSLRGLPAGIQVLLGVGETAEHGGGIADRDGRFSSTDALVEPLPMRRFALAAVGSDRVVVALEQGGIAYWVRAIAFRQVGATWEAERCAPLRGLPQHVADLLTAWTAQSAKEGWACQRPYSIPGAPPVPSVKQQPAA